MEDIKIPKTTLCLSTYWMKETCTTIEETTRRIHSWGRDQRKIILKDRTSCFRSTALVACLELGVYEADRNTELKDICSQIHKIYQAIYRELRHKIRRYYHKRLCWKYLCVLLNRIIYTGEWPTHISEILTVPNLYFWLQGPTKTYTVLG